MYLRMDKEGYGIRVPNRFYAHWHPFDDYSHSDLDEMRHTNVTKWAYLKHDYEHDKSPENKARVDYEIRMEELTNICWCFKNWDVRVKWTTDSGVEQIKSFIETPFGSRKEITKITIINGDVVAFKLGNSPF